MKYHATRYARYMSLENAQVEYAVTNHADGETPTEAVERLDTPGRTDLEHRVIVRRHRGTTGNVDEEDHNGCIIITATYNRYGQSTKYHAALYTTPAHSKALDRGTEEATGTTATEAVSRLKTQL